MPVPMMRSRSSRVRRSRGYNLPFEVDNRIALDAAVASSVTTSLDGVTQWADIGPSGNTFTNDHTAGSQPGYSGGLITFDGGDHLHLAGDLIPATGDWAAVIRLVINSTSGDPVFFAQYLLGLNGRLLFRSQFGQYRFHVAPGVILDAAAPSIGVPTTLAYRRAGNTWTHRVNGSGPSTTASQSVLAAGGNTIGCRSDSAFDSGHTNHLDGSIERIGIWQGTFNNDDLAEIEDWASNGG